MKVSSISPAALIAIANLVSALQDLEDMGFCPEIPERAPIHADLPDGGSVLVGTVVFSENAWWFEGNA